MDFLKDIRRFMRERKKYRLAPVLIVLFLLGFLIMFSGGSAVSPFIHMLF